MAVWTSLWAATQVAACGCPPATVAFWASDQHMAGCPSRAPAPWLPPMTQVGPAADQAVHHLICMLDEGGFRLVLSLAISIQIATLV